MATDAKPTGSDAKPTGSDAAPSSGGDGARLSSAKEEEEEEECGFCRFMKGGSCKTAFVQWEDCVDKAKEADGDFVEKCAKQTEALRDCMMADPGYYGDMLPDEEKAGGPEDGDAKGYPRAVRGGRHVRTTIAFLETHIISRRSFTLGVISWCQSTDLRE